MKPLYAGLYILAALAPLPPFARLINGGINAYFGAGGDTRSHNVKYGPNPGLIASNDRFSSAASGTNVIHTSNASVFPLLLQGRNKLGLNKKMSVLPYSKIKGKLWLDAVYGRDYVSATRSSITQHSPLQ